MKYILKYFAEGMPPKIPAKNQLNCFFVFYSSPPTDSEYFRFYNFSLSINYATRTNFHSELPRLVKFRFIDAISG